MFNDRVEDGLRRRCLVNSADCAYDDDEEGRGGRDELMTETRTFVTLNSLQPRGKKSIGAAFIVAFLPSPNHSSSSPWIRLSFHSFGFYS